jgi:hypothetical protein
LDLGGSEKGSKDGEKLKAGLVINRRIQRRDKVLVTEEEAMIIYIFIILYTFIVCVNERKKE